MNKNKSTKNEKKKKLRRERENPHFVCGKTMYRMRERK